ncbi:MAG: acetylornithine deacetylase [Planctomycetota bacterium]|jgi:acetylornithine deacetylase
MMRDAVLAHLERLVAFDTSNPPRRIDGAGGAVEHARTVLAAAGFGVTVDDLGDGQVVLLAVRGAPDVLFNVHLDTVPTTEADWTGDPWTLRVGNDRAVGLGACDVKGAAACLLAAAEQSDGPAALLLTTDEEAGASRCVRTFLEQRRSAFDAVVVAEPTGLRAVTAHRGIGSYELRFDGRAGHASAEGAGEASAVHRALRWGHAALAGGAGSADLRLNIGVLDGGTKANVAAASARVVFGIRPWTAADGAGAVASLRALPPADRCAALSVRFEAPPLASTPEAARLAARLGLETADPVDFWTEAALFAEAGLPAIVYGPGSIKQAHAADEWIALADLDGAATTYRRLLSSAAPGAA